MIDKPLIDWLAKNKNALLIVLLGGSLATNYYLWSKYTAVVEESIHYERERVKKFDEIVKKLIDQNKKETVDEN